METPLIRYNLKDRGRRHTGQPRNFNVKAICDAINGPACQEMVASRGMIGYYGHLPRLRYGMMPAEGGIEKGKYSPVEPAFVTTMLRADYDGNVEHRAEFLDTASGMLAEKLWKSRVGGFSSAIDENKPAFCGLDYVTNPNFLSNSFRGVVLDDALGGGLGELTYDDVFAAEQEEQAEAQAMVAVLDGINAERDVERQTFSATIEHLRAENEQLLSMLVARGGSAAALDSAAILPVAVAIAPAERLRRDAAAFRTALLPAFVEPHQAQPAQDPLYERLLARFARG